MINFVCSGRALKIKAIAFILDIQGNTIDSLREKPR